jgi:hypothetical protein
VPTVSSQTYDFARQKQSKYDCARSSQAIVIGEGTGPCWQLLTQPMPTSPQSAAATLAHASAHSSPDKPLGQLLD